MSVTNPFGKRRKVTDAVADAAAAFAESQARWSQSRGSKRSSQSSLPRGNKARRTARIRVQGVRVTRVPRGYSVMPGTRKRRFGGKTTRGRFSRFRPRRAKRARGALSTKMAGFRRRVRRRVFRRGRRLGYPRWFKVLTHGISPTAFAATYGGQLGAAYGTSVSYTSWKNLGGMETQACVDYALGSGGASGQTTVSANAIKVYVSDLRKIHRWRNSASGGEIEIQFYQMISRGHIPQNGSASISPTGGYAYNAQIGSNMPLWQQPFTDENAAVGSGTKMTYLNYSVTPFMNPVLCSMFKIKPLRVNGPNGKSSLQRLQPGQEATLESVRMKPVMYSANKLMLTGVNSNLVLDVWENRTEWPLLFITVRGSTSHVVGSVTTVLPGPAYVDYLMDVKAKLWQPTPIKANTWAPVTSASAGTNAIEQVDIVTAAESNIVNA